MGVDANAVRACAQAVLDAPHGPIREIQPSDARVLAAHCLALADELEATRVELVKCGVELRDCGRVLANLDWVPPRDR